MLFRSEGKGYIEISGGTIAVQSGGDAVDAVTKLRISGGTVSTASRQDRITIGSRKGLKAGQLLDVSGGVLEITADEDGLHCDGEVRMSGGEVRILATTGVQAGVRDSGEGDILLSGGKLFIAAVKQALKAEGNLFCSNELLALCGSDKQADPHEGGQAWLRVSVDGSQGDEVRIGMGTETQTAPLSFRILLYSSASLQQGDSVSLSVGSRDYTAAAR